MRCFRLILSIVVFAACQPSQSAPNPAAGAAITGTVMERVDGAPYSYLRLKTEQGEIWAAVPMESVANGGKVTVKNGAPVKGFTAPGINRKFEVVVFGVVEKG